MSGSSAAAPTLLHRWLVQELDTELRRGHRLAVTEFDVLITLFNAPDERLRMSELAERVILSPAGTTHLVTRLEQRTGSFAARSIPPMVASGLQCSPTRASARCGTLGGRITTCCD